jgi:hypothetical protein
MSSCKTVIQQFLDRSLESWTGLPTGCREEELAKWLAFNQGQGVTRRGSDHVAYTFRSLPYPGFIEGAFFYFDQGVLSFISTDYWSFDREECARAMRQLGEPTHRLDFNWGNEKIEAGEWVFTERGITLGVIPATQILATVMVFPPCTLSAYEAKYHRTTLAREFLSE